jgi:peptide methionine sulfoxide reductase MsrA
MGKTAEFSKRGSKNGDTYRMRIYSLHENQVEIIKPALEKAREESETEYDSVALTNICMQYLAT